MTETQQIVWFAIAAAAGILLGVAGSIWIDMLVKRSRVLVFGWLERELPAQARLSLYVKNESTARVAIKEIGTITTGGQRIPAGATPAHQTLFPKPLPLALDPDDATVVCVLTIDGDDAISDVASCYAIRSEGKFLRGPVFLHGR